MGNLIGTGVGFPDTGGIQGFFLSILSWIYNGVGVYALAIILFVVIIKIVLLPLDFGNRYFQKMNAIKMADMKPEQERLQQQHAGDPVAYNRARQQLMAKHSHGMMGFCLFMLLSVGLSILVFWSVFQALGSMSGFNANRQFIELRGVVQTEFQVVSDDIAARRASYQALYNSNTITAEQLATSLNGLNEEFAERTSEIAEDNTDALIYLYNETRVSFLWIHNMWQSDAFWTRRNLTSDQFYNATRTTQYSVFQNADGEAVSSVQANDIRMQHDAIFGVIDPDRRAVNGWLLLVLLAGVATFGSTYLMQKHQRANAPQKKPEDEEENAGYSIRTAKAQTQGGGSARPGFDPQMMGKMMKYMMPALMIVVSLTMTAAMALYIVVSQLMTAGLALAMTPVIDKLVKRSQLKKKSKDIDEEIINPHAKFFKNKHKG